MGALVEQRSFPGIQMPPADSMLTVIERAVMAPDFDVNKLAELLALRERYEQLEARKAYVEAMNVFKLNPPQIVKNHLVSFNNTSYRHATLDTVVRAVTESLSAVGISHRWATKQDERSITVTCILTHKQGHSEETALTGPADNSGSKNALQAIGSTVTYLERYTLMAACGLAAGEDDDGRAAISQPQGKETQANGIVRSEERVKNIAARIEDIMKAESEPDLRARYNNAYREAHEAGDREAESLYVKAKDKKKKELADATH